MKTFSKLLNRNLIVLIIFAVIGFALYWNVLKGPFLWDDRSIVLENEYITSFEYAPNWFKGENIEGQKELGKKFYRPVSTAFYTTVYSVAGLNVTAYHLSLILVHILNAFLVFILLCKLKFVRVGSFLAALIFLAHPVQTTSVSYIAAVPDVLAPFFTLLALIFYLSKKNLAHIGALVFMVLGILSKEVGIVFFPLAVLMEIYNWKNHSQKEKRGRKILLGAVFLISAIYVIARLTYINSEGLGLNSVTNPYTENLHIRLITFISVLWLYAKMIFAPVTLYFDRVNSVYETLFSLKGLFGLIVILGGTAASYFSYKKHGKFFLAFLWFFACLIPVMGIISPNNTYRENWIYLPIIGVTMLIPMVFEKLKTKSHKAVFFTLFVIVLVLLGTRTVDRNFEWADPYAFYENELEHNKIPRIYNQYAKLNYRDGNTDKAVELFEEGISLAQSGEGILTTMHYDLGVSYIVMKNLNKAIVHFLMVFETDVNFAKAHEQLGKLFRLAGYNDRAAKFEEFHARILNGGTVTFEEILASEELE